MEQFFTRKDHWKIGNSCCWNGVQSRNHWYEFAHHEPEGMLCNHESGSSLLWLHHWSLMHRNQTHIPHTPRCSFEYSSMTSLNDGTRPVREQRLPERHGYQHDPHRPHPQMTTELLRNACHHQWVPSARRLQASHPPKILKTIWTINLLSYQANWKTP